MKVSIFRSKLAKKNDCKVVKWSICVLTALDCSILSVMTDSERFSTDLYSEQSLKQKNLLGYSLIVVIVRKT